MRVTGIFQNYIKNSNYTKDLNFSAKRKGRKPAVKAPEGVDTFSKTQDKVTQTYHKNGSVSSRTVYRNGKPYKDMWYDFNGKMFSVRYFGGSFDLSRNAWYQWKKAPSIDFTREKDGTYTRLHAKPAVKPKDGKKGDSGAFTLDSIGEKTLRASIYVEPDGTYKCSDEEGLPDLKKALLELLDIISSDEYKDSFGGSRRMNNGIENAIKYIDSRTKQPA